MSEPVTTSDTPNSVYTGSESFFAFFSQAQVALQTFRLALDGRVLAQASDLASQIENTRRAFQHNGKFVETIQGVLRFAAQLQQRTHAWDREVQNIERSKHSKSGNALQQLRAEISNGRLKSQMTERIVSKLEIVLYQLESEEAERLVGQTASAETDIKSPPDSDETNSVVSQVIEAVCDLVGEGLIMNFDEETALVVDSNVREFFWDQPLVLLVAQWHCEDRERSDEVCRDFSRAPRRLERERQHSCRKPNLVSSGSGFHKRQYVFISDSIRRIKDDVMRQACHDAGGVWVISPLLIMKRRILRDQNARLNIQESQLIQKTKGMKAISDSLWESVLNHKNLWSDSR